MVGLKPSWNFNTLIPTRRAARLVLDETPVEPVGVAGDHTAAWRRVVDDGATMLCAELIGVCDAALELAVEYAKVRVQFDRPIASFQAIRHKAVDMLHRVELARVGTHYAAWTSDVDDAAREAAVAMAKGYVGEAAVFVTGEDIQIHGGVGFTWDCDAHFYFKRAKQNDVMLAAELVGSCEQAHVLAVEYAKVRVQFDRPLASFQAIRHKAVDMLHALELARVGTHYAAWCSDVDDEQRARAASMCKGFAGEAAVMISGESIQVHGGVGFTWDCDAHFHYKRAKTNDTLLGSQGHHRQRLAGLLLDA